MRVFILLICLTASLVFGQKYQGDITTSDTRIRDCKEKISFPEEMKFFYRGREGDYIIFYDLDGQEALYQYRRNRFDLDADIKLSGLREGQSYRVKGDWKGMLVYYDPISKKNFFPPEFFAREELKSEQIQDRNNKPVFDLDSYETTALDQVIY